MHYKRISQINVTFKRRGDFFANHGKGAEGAVALCPSWSTFATTQPRYAFAVRTNPQETASSLTFIVGVM